jgi:hypothetical protein
MFYDTIEAGMGMVFTSIKGDELARRLQFANNLATFRCV